MLNRLGGSMGRSLDFLVETIFCPNAEAENRKTAIMLKRNGRSCVLFGGFITIENCQMNRFNIRVYGLCVVDGLILLTDEIRMGIKMTKFPGGGLEFGEGLEDGLKREWQEELQTTITVEDVFYVNPFLQPSMFKSSDQVLAIYFWVKAHTPLIGEFRNTPMDFPNDEDDQQVFRWVSLDSLRPEDFTFPIDQHLVPKLTAWRQR